jgi:hypothetical protein
MIKARECNTVEISKKIPIILDIKAKKWKSRRVKLPVEIWQRNTARGHSSMILEGN